MIIDKLINIVSICRTYNIILGMLLYQVMCTQKIHYPMYLYAYCVMYDNHGITHAILLIFLSSSTVNGNNCSLPIYII